MNHELSERLSPGEQAMAAEILARGIVTKAQLDATIAAIDAGKIDGPLNKALYRQRLIELGHCQHLEEYLHKHLVFGDYTVERRLGAGAMGDVYLARGPDQQRVALKAINKRFSTDEQFITRFEREISILREISHENVARAVAFGSQDGVPFLALEYVPGPSLAALHDQNGPLPAPYVLRIAQQVAAGLDHIFERTRLVHRDIKPENILTIPDPERDDLFERRDIAKLIDFGLARSYATDERLTMTGITMGTPHYMSPEQIRGSQDVDQRADIYSLCATMYHLLTGSTPYRGNSPGEVMTAHLTEDVPDPGARVPSLSAAVRRIITTGMAKQVDARYLNYAAFTRACDEALGHGHASGMKLLRKPLVLPTARKPKAGPEHGNGQRRSENDTTRRQRPTPRPDPVRVDGHHPASYARVRTPPDGIAAEEAPSERHRTRSTAVHRSTAERRRSPIVTPVSTRRDHHADAERLEAESAISPGIGVIPIAILSAALIALVAVVVWRLVL